MMPWQESARQKGDHDSTGRATIPLEPHGVRKNIEVTPKEAMPPNFFATIWARWPFPIVGLAGFVY